MGSSQPICATCRVKPGFLEVIWKDLKGKWQHAHYCGPCAKANGDLQDERAQQSIAAAERAGA